MIDITLKKVDLEDEFELTVDVNCNSPSCIGMTGSTKQIRGVKLKKLVVECPRCHTRRIEEMVPFIVKTCREDWNYEPDVVQEVEGRLKEYI